MLVRVHQKLDRTRAHVIDGARRLDRDAAHLLADVLAHRSRRRLLDDLLVAALQRTFALVEMDDVPMAVAQYLDLDVARLFHEFLQIHAVVAEGRFGLRTDAAQRRDHVVRSIHQAHPFAAATGRRFEHDREADPFRGRRDLVLVAQHVGAGHDRHARVLHDRARGDLVAHLLYRVRLRADEDDARGAARRGERCAFGQKAVAGVNGVRAALGRGVQDFVRDEITLRGGGRPDRIGVVGVLDVQGGPVGVRIDRDRLDAEFAAGANHAHRDFAPVGDEHPFEHGRLGSVERRAPNVAPKAGQGVCYRGMLPCFLGGFCSRLFWSMASDWISRGRVSAGMMISST